MSPADPGPRRPGPDGPGWGPPLQPPGPGPIPPRPVGPPTVGPPTVGPPTVGPPTVGPPTVGPPTVGPPTVGLGSAVCYAHPDRRASSLCRRCDRPICVDCMREAPVGWQCPSCIRRDSRRAPVTRWQPRGGGALGANRLTPVVTAILAVNVVVFLLEETDYRSVLDRFAMVPGLAHHQTYRFVTAAFLHLDVTHIVLNMLTLLVVGPAVEASIGRTRTVGLYLLAAVGGEVLSYLLAPANEASVGASGAIFGLMGAYYVLARQRRWDLSLITPLIVINLVYSFLDPAIDWRAHVGGLLVGAGVAWMYGRTDHLPGGTRLAVQSAACVAVLAVLGLLSLLPPGHVNV